MSTKGKAMSKLSVQEIDKVAKALSKVPQPDQDDWHALFCAAMDDVGDVDRAIEAANELIKRTDRV